MHVQPQKVDIWPEHTAIGVCNLKGVPQGSCNNYSMRSLPTEELQDNKPRPVYTLEDLVSVCYTSLMNQIFDLKTYVGRTCFVRNRAKFASGVNNCLS